MRVVIVDQTMAGRDMLRASLAPYHDLCIVAECCNGLDAVAAIRSARPDVVFIDAQLRDISCFEVIELAAGRSQYIFVSSRGQWVNDALGAQGLDCLVRPYAQDQFDDAMLHARAQWRRRRGLAAVMRAHSARSLPLERVLVREGETVRVLRAGKIDFIEAHGDSVQINVQGRGYMKDQRLSDLERQLDSGLFMRVHPTCVLNVTRLRSFDETDGGGWVTLMDGTRIPVSLEERKSVRRLVGSGAMV